MANKTQLGIGAVIAVFVAGYLGLHQNNDKNVTLQTPNTNSSNQQQSIEPQQNSQDLHGLEVIRKAYDHKLSKVQVQSMGKVKAVLRDDTEGSKHQKFILSLDNGLTVLVAHNIDLAPRIENLKKGDLVEFFGEYEYTDQGGVVHWTHRDPSQRHENGWLKHDGKTYS